MISRVKITCPPPNTHTKYSLLFCLLQSADSLPHMLSPQLPHPTLPSKEFLASTAQGRKEIKDQCSSHATRKHIQDKHLGQMIKK